MLTQQRKTSIYNELKKDPAIGLMKGFEALSRDLHESLEKGLEKIKESIPSLATQKGISSLRGEKGDPGNDGKTPQKFKDYFTADEIEQISKRILKLATPKKGRDYFTDTDMESGLNEMQRYILQNIIIPKKGDKGDKGDNGKNGKDGYTPRAGIDYPTRAELTEYIHNILPAIREKLNEKPQDIVDKVNSLPGSIEQKTIKDFDKMVKSFQTALRERGGGKSGGGGMGNIQHESHAVNSGTTSLTTTYKIGGNGYAIWAYYQGQMIVRGTHYSVSGKTISITFTPTNNTTIDLIYMRT